MDACTIYCDGNSADSVKAAKVLAEDIGGNAVAAQSCSERIIYEKNSEVGFIFTSDEGALPAVVRNVVNRIVMDKSSYIFAVVIGGPREVKAVKEIYELLENRGYQLSCAYTEFLLAKISPDWREQFEQVEEDIANRHETFSEGRKYLQSLTRHELKKVMRKNLKEFLDFKRRQRKGSM